jgi:hypothetical protein
MFAAYANSAAVEKYLEFCVEVNVIQQSHSLENLFESSVNARSSLMDVMKNISRDVFGESKNETEETKDKFDLGPLEDVTRSVEKITRDYDNKYHRLIDIVRGSIILSSMSDIESLLDYICNSPSEKHDWKIIRIKNGFVDKFLEEVIEISS